MFALVDCNNFYASCQRVFNPQLQGKPIVILSNNDGCVIARSNEAKACGIPMGAPAFEYKKQFEEHNIHVFSSNFALYGDMSSRVMNTLSQFSPDMEVYSVDEAFLKFTGFEHFDLKELGLKMRRTTTKNTGIPVSIGFAPTKALAKIANKIAKKYPLETRAVHTIDTEEKRIKALRWTKIEDVWGIGKKHAQRLKAQNVHTALDFTKLPDAWVRKNMHVVGLRLKKELEGLSALDLEPIQNKKMIATTRSFDKPLTTLDELEERVATYAILGAEKLRRQNSHCQMLMVFLQTNPHRQDQPQYYRNIVVNHPFPTDSSIDIVRLAKMGLKQIFRANHFYKKAGVILMDITPNQNVQLNLFSQSNPKHPQLMATIDKINLSLGNHKVKFASQALDRVWKMRQEQLSPNYTTNIKDIITIKL
ncbi:MAG: Y-family DNA polymerase [Flavobacterium sp.]|nr:Y-family DNA polymerase [Candidatus Neoflavobacterium equi]